MKYDPHADRHNRERDPMLYYASRFMETLLGGVFLFFGLHTLLWFTRTAPARRARKPAEARAAREEEEKDRPGGEPAGRGEDDGQGDGQGGAAGEARGDGGRDA